MAEALDATAASATTTSRKVNIFFIKISSFKKFNFSPGLESNWCLPNAVRDAITSDFLRSVPQNRNQNFQTSRDPCGSMGQSSGKRIDLSSRKMKKLCFFSIEPQRPS